MTCYCAVRCFFSAASLTLTLALIAVGISFFAPYWLSNVQYGSDWQGGYLNGPVPSYPYRGLWAQCGSQCQWFWEYGYQLQEQKFTVLKWHLATQILYFIAASLVLIAEIYARVQLCCRERSAVYLSLGVMIFLSALLQTASLATFGGGASRAPYNATSDPTVIQQMLSGSTTINQVYLGWAFWMALVGDLITILAGLFFMFAACCSKRRCCSGCDCCDSDY